MTIDAKLHRAHGALTTLSNGWHVWNADVDKTLGSDDQAPDPHDLLDSVLAACTALTLELYIRRRQMPVSGVARDRRSRRGKKRAKPGKLPDAAACAH